MTERQKQLRDAYKSMKPPMGVYIFECLPTWARRRICAGG